VAVRGEGMATIMSQGFGRGGLGRSQRCDATCHKASRPKCVCICGGRYHGAGSSATAQQQLTSDWLGEDWVEQIAALTGKLAGRRIKLPPTVEKRTGVAFEAERRTFA